MNFLKKMFIFLKNSLKKMFTFLKDSSILIEIKTALLPVVQENVNELRPKVLLYINDKTAYAKEKLIDFILTKIKLPWYLKLFKGRVKNALNKKFDKTLDFILQAIGLK